MPELKQLEEAHALLRDLPYPLELTAGLYLRRKELRQMASELDAMSAEERARQYPDIDLPGWAWGLREAISSVMKVVTLIALADYIRLPAEAQNRKLNASIVTTMAGAPPERRWLNLLDELLKFLDTDHKGSVFPSGWLDRGTPTGISIRGVLHQLIDFRDQVAHGNFAWERAGPVEPGDWTVSQLHPREPKEGDQGRPIEPEDISSVELRLDAVFEELRELTSWQLFASWEDGIWYLARGAEVRLAEPQPDLPDDCAGQCVLVRGDEVLPLHPWALLKPAAGGMTVEFSELPLFDKLAATRPEFLAYAEGALYRRELHPPTYDRLRALMQELEAASDREQPDVFPWDDLLEIPPTFAGREDVMEAVRRFAETGEGYGLLRAVAGQGKTAVFSRLYRQLGGARREGPVWLWHFSARGENRDSGYRFLRSVLAQLSDVLGDDFPRDKWHTKRLEELRDGFGELLGEAASAAGRRVALVIDAIDEAATGGEYSIPNCLPSQLPDGVVIIVSERCSREGTPEIDLARFGVRPTDLLEAAGMVSPMAGLALDDVRSLLNAAAADVRREAVSNAVLEKVYRSSDEGNALFVRFITDDIRGGEIDPQNPASVPDSLHDYFDAIWDALPSEHDLLAHRLLLVLAVLQEPASDSLLADLVNESLEFVEASRAQLGKWLSVREHEGGPRYRHFHGLFIDYVLNTMRPTEIRNLHTDVASYCLSQWEEEKGREGFRPDRLGRSEALLYALMRLPWHLVEGRQWERAHETLTDFRFLEAKATHVAATALPDGTRQYGGVYELQEDLRRVLAALPT